MTSVRVLRRFDRDHGRRIPYISAMPLLERTDGAEAERRRFAPVLDRFL